MTSICGKISANITIDCLNPLQGGVDDRLILINSEDISSITRNVTNPQIIEAIILASGTIGYEVEGKNQSVDGKQTFVKQKYSEVFDHEVNFYVFDITPDIKLQLEKMSKGKLVALLQNNFKGAGGNAAFEIYGLDAGLRLSAMDKDTNNVDTQGAYFVTLKTNDVSKEPHLPATLFLTDYATSLAIVNGLL